MGTIILQNLSKSYPNGKQAVRNITLSLKQGTVFGFLGPNGAGKTTTVKLLTGILTPTSGHCLISGNDPSRSPKTVHALAGVVTEHAQMYDSMTGLENLSFYASIFGISKKEGRLRAITLLDDLGLLDAKDQKLAAYSTGMRQRLSLARALIHHPKVLFLDEPTSGLDPESAKNVNRLIQTLAQKDEITIFLCTHQLRYAQEICTSYGLISEGALLAHGSLTELRKKIGSVITLCIRAASMPQSYKDFQTASGQYELKIRSETEIPRIICDIVNKGGEIFSVAPRQPSLEDLYFTFTGKGKETEK